MRVLFTVQSASVWFLRAAVVSFLIFVHSHLRSSAKGRSQSRYQLPALSYQLPIDFPFGDYIRGATPLPIPNREVKPSRADDT